MFKKILFLENQYKSMINNVKEILKFIIEKNNKNNKIFEFLASKLYIANKFYIKRICQDYTIDNTVNLCIICENTKDIKINLPENNTQNKIGIVTYLINSSNFNVIIHTKNKIITNHLSIVNQTVLIRPYNLIKITLLNEFTYLIIKI